MRYQIDLSLDSIDRAMRYADFNLSYACIGNEQPPLIYLGYENSNHGQKNTVEVVIESDGRHSSREIHSLYIPSISSKDMGTIRTELNLASVIVDYFAGIDKK